ncbi:MAG: NrsF family protein [Gammaproteobacteria bacterium]
MNTEDLIENLGQELRPVAPLWPPGRRAAAWCIGAAVYLGLLVAVMSTANARAGGAGVAFWASQIAAVVMGLLASRAAFVSVVPGLSKRSRLWAAVAVAALVWLATLVAASPRDFEWAAVLTTRHEWVCVGFIIIGGAPLMWMLAVMLRRGAPLHPAATAAFAALAVGALANVGACLSLPHANSAITFAWHGGVVLALVAVAALAGRFVFAWSAAR